MRIAVALFWIFVLYALALGYLESPQEPRPLSEISNTYRSDAARAQVMRSGAESLAPPPLVLVRKGRPATR